MTEDFEIDRDDRRELAIEASVGGDAHVLWRRDEPWFNSPEIVERNVAGIVAGPDGPDLFMASCYVTGHGDIYPKIHRRVPIAAAVAARLPGTGDFAAHELRIHPHGDYDNAVAKLYDGRRPRYFARHANTTFSAYLLRLGGADDARIAVAMAFRGDGGYRAEAEREWTTGEIAEIAAREFHTPLAGGPARC